MWIKNSDMDFNENNRKKQYTNSVNYKVALNDNLAGDLVTNVW